MTDLTSASVVADSTWEGTRLVTFHLTFPRFILAEFNTHRAFSRNSASSRAIPVAKTIGAIQETPFVPATWPKNRAGMSAETTTPHGDLAINYWLEARDAAIKQASNLAKVGVHKQIANRLLEPFMWHTVIISTTLPGLENFFAQRDHPDAQPEIQALARKMREALDASTPVESPLHVPFFESRPEAPNVKGEATLIRSISKCARVSYGRELEERTFEEDRALVVRLARDKHWSPFEHVAFADLTYWDNDDFAGNFSPPWNQARHHLEEVLPSIHAELTTA